MDIEKELILREIYYNPKIGYRSGEHLYKQVQQEHSDISRNFVRQWLQKQKAYRMHKKFKRPQSFQKTIVYDLAEQVQIDLVVLSTLKGDNDGYQYIFMAVEILSRFAFATALKNRDGKTTSHTIGIVSRRFSR